MVWPLPLFVTDLTPNCHLCYNTNMETSDVATGFAELNNKTKKILLDLCDTLAEIGQANIIRYYTALLIADLTGNGWVYSDWYISAVSHFFYVQPRQVKKSIKKMANLGMVDIVGDRIYYRSQEKIIERLGGEMKGYLAAKTKMSDLRGAVRARSHFGAAKLQAATSGETIMISRKGRQEKLNAPSPKTQRKYDKMQGVKHYKNFATVRECKKDDIPLVRDTDTNVIMWKEFIGNKYYYVRSLSHIYLMGNLNKVGIRKRTRSCQKSDTPSDPKIKLYFDKLPNKWPGENLNEIYVFKEHAGCDLLPSFGKNLWQTIHRYQYGA